MVRKNLQSEWMARFAQYVTVALCAILFICANTNSSCLFHQPEMPKELDKFSKIK